ncbi:hypothetical protein MMC25_003199 [Agyrium rufum]|nr:hypothetical protein [Agyrium rufum]
MVTADYQEDENHTLLKKSHLVESLRDDITFDFAQPHALREYILNYLQHYAHGIEREVVQKEAIDVAKITLNYFLQANVTGPPLSLSLDPAPIFFHRSIASNASALRTARQRLIADLSTDGIAAYQLIPFPELFSLASAILNAPSLCSPSALNFEVLRLRIHVNFLHQRMLNEISDSLQSRIYEDCAALEEAFATQGKSVLSEGDDEDDDARARFLVERAAIHIFHGLDAKAREDLEEARRVRGLEYVLTGRLGRRTKFQDRDLSQLVVLARSKEDGESQARSSSSQEEVEEKLKNAPSNDAESMGKGETGMDGSEAAKPQNLDLNDDTLLEAIAFKKTNEDKAQATDSEDPLPSSLATLNPSNQPILHPLDSIILLQYASSVTNTSPSDGLTREETVPYAIRVLDGGSSNWQIYTEALLVRSRTEGYRSRTVERGVLQLQALVDQVVAETTLVPSSDETRASDNNTNGGSKDSTTSSSTPTTFLPRPKPSESAPASERLKYIHELAFPTRWTLEAELAARWVSLGGLRTALEIYERLKMWAEAALCWAAIEREDKARRIVRRLLYQPASAASKTSSASTTAEEISSRDDINAEADADAGTDADAENYLGPELHTLPADAPRLFCILGDLDQDPKFYKRAWEVSGNRYARAQRSLGKHYLITKQLDLADEAYALSLKYNPQNQATWFALGCVRLEVRNWRGAVEAFQRAIQIEEQDAESWSNLAAALIRLPSDEEVQDGSGSSSSVLGGDHDLLGEGKKDLQKHVRQAFTAFKRAAALKRNSHRIWQNLMNVAVTLIPPPYSDIVLAQQRLIELRGATEGESCVDVEAMEGLLTHVIAMTPASAPLSGTNGPAEAAAPRRQPRGLEYMFSTLLTKHITPLITHSRRLWLLTARFAIHQNRPSAALAAYEKAWRATTQRPGWDSTSTASSSIFSSTKKGKRIQEEEIPEKVWTDVVDSTIELVDAYESLGMRERTEGLGAGAGGDADENRNGEKVYVCKEWRFKARSAVRGILGRGKEFWEGNEGWERLKERGRS